MRPFEAELLFPAFTLRSSNDMASDVATGRCSARHAAVLWKHGVLIDLGSLGGVAWNTPTALNNEGMMVGFSDLPGDSNGAANYQLFIWTRSTGMKKVPLLPGETRRAAFGINDRGQVVGLLQVPGTSYQATLWQNGSVTDLNSLSILEVGLPEKGSQKRLLRLASASSMPGL